MSAIRPHLEARAQPIFERRHRLRRPVAGQDDLAAAFVDRVEGVEELFLGALLAGDELDVVDQQHAGACGTCAGNRRCGAARIDSIRSLVNVSDET